MKNYILKNKLIISLLTIGIFFCVILHNLYKPVEPVVYKVYPSLNGSYIQPLNLDKSQYYTYINYKGTIRLITFKTKDIKVSKSELDIIVINEHELRWDIFRKIGFKNYKKHTLFISKI